MGPEPLLARWKIYTGEFNKGVVEVGDNSLGQVGKDFGNFKKGLINGQGEMNHDDGRKYIGNFQNGKNMAKAHFHGLTEDCTWENS